MPENKRHPTEYLSKAWIKRYMIVFARLSEIDQTLLVLQLAIEVSTATTKGMVAFPRETKYILIGDDSLRRKRVLESSGYRNRKRMCILQSSDCPYRHY